MTILLQILNMSPNLAIFGLLVWFGLTKMKAYDEHVKECGKIPKEFIMDKVACVQADVSDVKETIIMMSDRQLAIGNNLQVLIGRQTEKDFSRNRRRGD